MSDTIDAIDVPNEALLAQVADFIREPVLVGDEDPAVTLAPGTARRRAFDAAAAELAEGLPAPSTHWRRKWSLLLGLERMLAVDEPRLADGKTLLNPHQVDALSGTLTALLTEAQGGTPVSIDEQPEEERPTRRGGNNGASSNYATSAA